MFNNLIIIVLLLIYRKVHLYKLSINQEESHSYIKNILIQKICVLIIHTFHDISINFLLFNNHAFLPVNQKVKTYMRQRVSDEKKQTEKHPI